MTDTKLPTERRVVLPVDPTRRTEIDKQRVPMSARPYRLLALVKQDAVVRVQKEPDDTVMTWPHLLSIEFLAAGVMSIVLLDQGQQPIRPRRHRHPLLVDLRSSSWIDWQNDPLVGGLLRISHGSERTGDPTSGRWRRGAPPRTSVIDCLANRLDITAAR